MEEQRRPPAVLTAYYMPKPGGLCKRLFRAMEALLARGCTVHYAAVRRFPIEHPNCHWHRLWWPERWPTRGALFWTWLHLAMPWQLLYLGLRHRVTHAFAFSINYGAMLLPLRLLTQVSYAVFLRADTRQNNEINGVRASVLRLESWLEAAALWRGHVVSVSQTLLNTVLSRHPRARPQRWNVLANEPPAGRYSGRPYNGGRLEVGLVGVVEARKRPRLAVDALTRLRDTDLRLNVFGSGPQAAALQHYATQCRQRERVVFHGWRPTEEIWAQIHVMLHPSLHEGRSNAVLEALAAGVPVFASDIPEHREYLPESMLLSTNDPNAWATALYRLTQNPAAHAEMRRAVLELASTLNFDWEASACAEILGEKAATT